MRRSALLWVGFLGLAAPPMAASAVFAQEACTFRQGQRPNVVENRNGDWGVLSSASGCQATFPAGGRNNLVYTSATIARAPANGTVRVQGTNRFVYIPRSGTRTDSFVLRVCGRNNFGSGCANILYDVTMR